MRKLVLLLLLVSSCLLLPPRFSYADLPEPPKTFGNSEAPEIATIDWEEFWALFNTVSAWDLEYSQGAGWNSIKEDLTILRNYTEPWICKISLIFNASYHADYRLTFLVDRRVKNYTYVENRTRYELSYQNYTLFFSWEDLLGIPGLQFSHGMKEISGKPCFWFRLRRDDVPQGTYLELDPTFGYSDIGEDQHYWSGGGDKLVGCCYTCPYDGEAHSITVTLYTSSGLSAHSKCALYRNSDLSFVAETEERYFRAQGTYTYNFASPYPPLEANTDYLLCVWYDETYKTYYDSGSTNQTCRDIEPYDGFPSTFTKDNCWDEKTSIYCIYSISNTAPNIGIFSSSDDPVYANSWFNVNCTIADEDGISELENCTLELSGDLILGWDNSSSTFSIEADPNGYCTLNSSESIEHELNSTAFELSWRIQLHQNYPHASSVDIVADNTTVYDTEGASGSGSHSRLFVFEPEESGEPGAVTGGIVRKKTPLEELGVPTPFPYEVASPEAQYGSIGLVVIFTGGVIYYIRRPKTTQQLFRENTASRVKYGPRKPRKRGIKTKKAPKRRVHSKK